MDSVTIRYKAVWDLVKVSSYSISKTTLLMSNTMIINSLLIPYVIVILPENPASIESASAEMQHHLT